MKKTYTILFFITVISLLSRIYKLTEYPPSLFIDEYNVGFPGLEILKSVSKPLWHGIGWYGTPAGSFYYFALLMKIFGANNWGLRLSWAIPGALTVPFAFLFFKHVFGLVPAFVGSLFLTLSPLHNHLSRWAHGGVIVSFLLYVALFLYERIKREKLMLRQLLLCVCIGFVLAGMIYTYVGGRALAGAFFLYSIIDYLSYLLDRQKISKREIQISFLHIFVVIFVFFMLITPFLRYGLEHRQELLARTEEISIIRKELSLSENISALKKNIGLYLGMFYTTPDTNPRHTPYPGKPVFGLFYSLFFIIGLTFFFLEKKQRAVSILFLFFGIMATGIFSNEAPSIFRTVGIIPLFYALCGYGVSYMINYFSKARLQKGKSANLLVLLNRKVGLVASYAIVIAVIAVTSKNFVEFIHLIHNPLPIQFEAFTYKENLVAKVSKDFGIRGRQVYLTPDFYWFSSVRFNYLANKNNILYEYRPYFIGNEDAMPEKSVLVLEYPYIGLKDYFHSICPLCTIHTYETKSSYPLVVVLWNSLSSNAIQLKKKIGLTVRLYTDEDKKVFLGSYRDPTVYTALMDRTTMLFNDSFYSEWNGLIVFPENGEYIFRGEADDEGGMKLIENDGNFNKELINISLQPQFEKAIYLENKAYDVVFMYKNLDGSDKFFITVKGPRDDVFKVLNPLWLKPDET